MLLHTFNAAQVLEHLRFRSSDGSLTWTGKWGVVVGAFIVIGSVANVFVVGPTARRLAGIVPRLFVRIWGCVGIAVGGFFIWWPFHATPGRLY